MYRRQDRHCRLHFIDEDPEVQGESETCLSHPSSLPHRGVVGPSVTVLSEQSNTLKSDQRSCRWRVQKWAGGEDWSSLLAESSARAVLRPLVLQGLP